MQIAEKVTAIFRDCLFREQELIDGKPTSEPVLTRGVIVNVGFHKERLEQHRKEVREILEEMPDAFHVNKGGGMSFLALCDDRHGNQWTGLQLTMDELVALSIALGFGKFCLPRETWVLCPGGMPYIVFDLTLH